MSNSVISKGKDIDEAISLGLRLLKSSEDEVDIEVIDAGGAKLFSRMKRPAVVKVTKRSIDLTKGSESHNDGEIEIEDLVDFIMDENHSFQQDAEETIQTAESTDRSGMIWVNDGQVYWDNADHQYPTISPSYQIDLFINDQLQTTPTILTKNDSIKTEPKNEEKETTWDIRFNKDETLALIHVDPGYKIKRQIKDAEPVQHLILSYEESCEIKNALTIEAIQERLEGLGVVYGIDYQAITDATKVDTPSELVIAQGIEPVKGKDGDIEFKVNYEEDDSQPKVKEDGLIDFREVRSIPDVKQGQLIGVVKSPVAGKPGISVKGEKINPKPVHDIVVKPGKGVQYQAGEIIALSFGRPQIECRGTLVKVDVLKKFILNEDVSLSTGNVRFHGDIAVNGNVDENMEVEAKGEVVISGTVVEATITTGDSIKVCKNVISSTLTAGKSHMIISEMTTQLNEIFVNIGQLISAIKQLMIVPAFQQTDIRKRGLGPLIKILQEKKFQPFTNLVQGFIRQVQTNRHILDDEWIALSDKLYKSFIVLSRESLQSIEQAEALKNEIETLYKIANIPPDPDAKVIIPYAIKSSIFSSGDIHVIGQGCYHTKIRADANLIIRGFVRGGDLYAGSSIEIKEAGSQGGVETKIVVPRQGTIKIDHAYEGTVIQVGKRKYQFTEERKHIYARLNENDELLF